MKISIIKLKNSINVNHYLKKIFSQIVDIFGLSTVITYVLINSLFIVFYSFLLVTK